MARLILGKVMLGEKYREKLHGIEGIAVSRTEYIHGCARVTLEFMKDGERKTEFVDELQLEDVTPEEGRVGGPGDVVPRQADPPPR